MSGFHGYEEGLDGYELGWYEGGLGLYEDGLGSYGDGPDEEGGEFQVESERFNAGARGALHCSTACPEQFPPLMNAPVCWDQIKCKLWLTTQKRDEAYGIVRARVRRAPDVGAGDVCNTRRRRGESVALKVYAGADKRATVLTSIDCSSPGGGEQRQEGNNQGNGANHVERRGGRGFERRELLLRTASGVVRETMSYHWAFKGF